MLNHARVIAFVSNARPSASTAYVLGLALVADEPFAPHSP
jgi:hypothetical protein